MANHSERCIGRWVSRRIVPFVLTLALAFCAALAIVAPSVERAEAVPTYQLYVDVSPASGGLVSSDASWDTPVGFFDFQVAEGTYYLEAHPYEDYKFLGWYDDGASYLTSDNPYYIYVAQDTIIHARYEYAPADGVFFECNSSNPSYGWVDGPYGYMPKGDTITVSAHPYLGYEFRGWTDDNGYPVSPYVTYTFDIYSELHLVAQFDSVDAIRTVYIEPNGGTGYMPDPTMKTGSIYVLPECEFTPPYGKEFDTWDVGAPGTSITVNSDMTITAQWKDVPYCTVWIEPNGGSGFIPDPSFPQGTIYTLPECPFTAPEGMEFAGWDAGQPGTQIKLDSSVAIYAQWQPIPEPQPQPSQPEASSSSAASSASAESASSSASSSASTTASSTSASSSSASESASASSASSTSSTSSSSSGSSGSGSSGNQGQSSNGELPILPIAGGVVAGALIAGIIAAIVLRRKK